MIVGNPPVSYTSEAMQNSPKIIILGTKNKDKLRELRSLLKGSKVTVRSLSEFPGCPEAVENGRTFEANARKKARAYSLYTKSAALADDSGLMVHALNGRPGVYSARFAGKNCTYQDNNAKLLRLLKPKKNRRAKFVSCMALYDNGRFIACVKGECRGKITAEARGKNGFGYDPVFIPAGSAKTFAEISSAAKNKISHRSNALKKVKKDIIRHLHAH